MKYALVNNERTKPIPKIKGKCIGCGEEVISKCGKIKVWHWAHRSKRHCDSWWENEGEWHRKWKSCFPESFQEVRMQDEKTEEFHIADIQLSNGLVIELQNSAISIDEVRSRENFYKNMIWIVNAEKFKGNIKIGHKLPSSDSNFSKDIFFYNRTKYNDGVYLNKSQWHLKSESKSGFLIHFAGQEPEVISEVESNYNGDHFFHWKRPRIVWLNSNVSVFFDFGEDCVWQLNLNHPNASKQLVIKQFVKEKFIAGLREESERYVTPKNRKKEDNNKHFSNINRS